MPRMTLKRAETIVGRARAAGQAAKMKPLALVVLDSGGHVIFAVREDGATMLRFDIARAKAWTALGLANDSRFYQDMAESRPNFAASLNVISNGRMAAAAGGVLIQDGDMIIGAIGVSGDTPDNDERAGKAGVDG